jgi:thiamine kinase-like enzyme
LEKYNLTDEYDYINGCLIPPMKKLLEEVDFHSMMGKGPTGFHGDFILDNILISDDKITLIDWRQDFNGSIDAGDMNYDLAKLNHNLTLNHEILDKNLYSIDFVNGIQCDILVKKSMIECKELLKNFCEHQGIDYKSIEILSSIIWVNMSPLHEHPLDMFLYYFGKYNLFLNLR